MTRGKEVIQRVYERLLSDLTTFCISKGLSWETGSDTRVETNISKWISGGRRLVNFLSKVSQNLINLTAIALRPVTTKSRDMSLW